MPTDYADKNSKTGADPEFRYPGKAAQYLRQSFVSGGLALVIVLLFVLFFLVVDRFLFSGRFVHPVHAALAAALAGLWGIFSVQMALSLASFSLVIENGALLVNRGNRTASIPFSDIVSVEIIRNPVWWALRADLKPVKDTARHMVRINRTGGPPVTFAGGLQDEERLVRMIQSRLDAV